jgi:hypothetical protein
MHDIRHGQIAAIDGTSQQRNSGQSSSSDGIFHRGQPAADPGSYAGPVFLAWLRLPGGKSNRLR